ncbi:hypothetical protein HY636_00675 [Candidatus Woesearchaeota archaeon]|nr:hypothetical protein [Candidatus Woesearchaeota archaeon]
MKITLEDYLIGLKSAFDVKDEEKLKLEFKIRDNYSIAFYGQEGDEFDENEHILKTVVSDIEASTNSDEFFSQTFSLRKSFENNDIKSGDHFKIRHYNVDDKIVIVQINRTYLYYGNKPRYGLLVRFHPYQVHDFLPPHEKFSTIEEAIEQTTRRSALIEEQYPNGAITFAMAKVIYNFGQYVVRRGFKVEFDSTGMPIRNTC